MFAALPDALSGEVFEELVHAGSVRIERIVSRGQQTPEGDWYDQQEHEWVIVLQGAARVILETAAGDSDESSVNEVALEAGDYLNIPAGCRHRVSWTAPDQVTIWLAVFYR
ncbi:cupin domain-containing protein [Microbulbifer hydrolyticus]|uniref:Cupin 2 domain-containing protein n=1 Tax=Microbulbifer hydrolyticus TaxID=48074 RepID=A0AA89PFQ6_9GAMM|nr:cupin domain-containing protein [Microbulbifer hydrolyticus]MBB5213095.1 cupin 2 domain-containing protein [Microbulbifer hydrolyticus]